MATEYSSVLELNYKTKPLLPLQLEANFSTDPQQINILKSHLAYSQLLSAKFNINFERVLLLEEILEPDQLLLYFKEEFDLDIITYQPNSYFLKEYFNFDNYQLKEVLPAKTINDEKLLIFKDFNFELAAELIGKYPGYRPVLCKEACFYKIINENFKELNLYNSLYMQRFKNTKASAYNLQTFTNRGIYLGGMLLMLFGFFQNSLLQIIGNIIYLSQNIFKLELFWEGLAVKNKLTEQEITNFPPSLPIYSILIPLYREAGKAGNLLEAIKNLHYPKSLLDVKIIIEEDDIITWKALQIIGIPSFCQIIKVPFKLPRTKPKALNFAMPYVKGELLVIYDAEDKPEPNQLLKAVAEFKKLPEEYAAIQANLNFYNAKNNFLNRLFSLEYKIWFEYLLLGLATRDLPVTLGGTSNHIKIKYLKEVGLWDAFNVTEDAELGLRFKRNGYKIGMLHNSITWEEAPAGVASWRAQRTRWIKGFIITFLTHLRQSDKNFTIPDKISIHIFIGFTTLSFLLTPILTLYTFISTNNFINSLWLINTIFSFGMLWSVAGLITFKQRNESKLKLLDFAVIGLFPIYFWLHSYAAYFAVVELLFKPFRWNKTDHGQY